jgi:pyocin large subunit-like protein
MNGVAVTPLTVDFHESGFRSKLNSESNAPFWFQMDGDAKQQHGSPMGPANPQALNRYSYVQNNPLKYTDPTGHSVYMTQQEARRYANVTLTNVIIGVRQSSFISALTAAALGGGGGAAIVSLLQGMGISAAFAAAAAPVLIAAAVAAIVAGEAVGQIVNEWAAQLTDYRDILLEVAAQDDQGIIVSWDCANKLYCDATVVGRSTGNGYVIGMSKFAASFVVDWQVMDGTGNRSIWEAGRACTLSGGNPDEGNYFKRDTRLCR